MDKIRPIDMDLIKLLKWELRTMPAWDDEHEERRERIWDLIIAELERPGRERLAVLQDANDLLREAIRQREA